MPCLWALREIEEDIYCVLRGHLLRIRQFVKYVSKIWEGQKLRV